jgi:hypothetical protein
MSDERGSVGDDSAEDERGLDVPPGGGGFTGPTGGGVNVPPGGGGFTGPTGGSGDVPPDNGRGPAGSES